MSLGLSPKTTVSQRTQARLGREVRWDLGGTLRTAKKLLCQDFFSPQIRILSMCVCMYMSVCRDVFVCRGVLVCELYMYMCICVYVYMLGVFICV